ncbi:MAG: glycosyltransferase [Candidatus Zambryskibacteria bacterium]|nr:glycosyltransferase [Candidatus Zambryskibacteria bacterium]
MTQQIDKQNIIKKIIGNDFVYSETISPLSNLCQYLINKKISSKKDWFIFHNKFLEVFIAQYKPTIDQLTFIRAVSLNTIFKDNGFPKIGNFASDEVDNIRFEPILNKNLLLINRDCLQNLMKEPDVELKKLAVTELNIIEKEIARIDNIINRVPDILTKDLSGGLKKVNGKPKVTVITASYNLASMVEETIRSVANQNYDSFEHIVIDGASTDGSVEVQRMLIGKVLD